MEEDRRVSISWLPGWAEGCSKTTSFEPSTGGFRIAIASLGAIVERSQAREYGAHGLCLGVFVRPPIKQRFETLAICRSLALARAVFAAAVEEKPATGS